MKKLFALIFTLFALFAPLSASARDASQITDWYIKDFQSEIIVNKDSSLAITENITADCGTLPGKHGIFRIMPTFYQKTETEKVNTPVKLKSITDFNGNPIPYSTSKNPLDKTITWKIGDANKTVTGINNYRIKYTVQNTIRFDNSAFDELYWNLNGNFWDIETDHFVANIKFPLEINKENIKEINLYSGSFGQNTNNLATYKWTNDNILEVETTRVLNASEGITLSATFSKNIITPYKPSFMEKYGQFLFLLIPILIFLVCLNIWRRYGKDFKLNQPIMAEYDVPDNLSPIEFATLYSNKLPYKAISAAIIGLAVNGYLKIEQLEKKGIFGKQDYKLTKLDGSKPISDTDKSLLAFLFGGSSEINLNDLINKFYSNIPRLRDSAIDFLTNNGYIEKSGLYWQIGLSVAGIVFIGISFVTINFSLPLMATLILSGVIILIFAAIMPKRTQKGAETLQKIQGFKLFISMTEKYRANFDEKENIFEKYLPYAMIFGLTSVWVNNMKKIYGETYFNTYHPYWFYGPAFINFNADTFNSMISDLSNNMNSTIVSNPSSSGSGGGGFSGGGGGGGGGGGW